MGRVPLFNNHAVYFRQQKDFGIAAVINTLCYCDHENVTH